MSGVIRALFLLLASLALVGCPHQSDSEDPRLVGKYVAVDPKRTILGTKSLEIIDAHHLKTDRGKVILFSVSEEFFSIDRPGDDDLVYSTSTQGYEEGILFQHSDRAQDPKQDIFYRRVVP